MTTSPVQVRVSQATRLLGSSLRQASRIASEIWSAILSGCPSVTDSEVKRYRFLADKFASPCGSMEFRVAGKSDRSGHVFAHFRGFILPKTLPDVPARRNEFGPIRASRRLSAVTGFRR